MIVISKQKVCQRFIFKINSSRLRKARWNLELPLDEARRNDEIIALADSQVLRWIDELNNLGDTEAKAKELKSRIKELRKLDSGIQNRREIKRLYSELDKVQFKPDYMCLIIDKNKDYFRACKGFSINGVRYKRLLGTNGGIKCSTIVFVSERVYPEIQRRIENDRDTEVKFVPAKLEAYKALTCSASTPVSAPRGVLVVNDVFTTFKSSVIHLTDEDSDEPIATEINDYDCEINACDGFGLMLPSLAKRWGEELGLDYIPSAVNTRFSFEKGVAFTFDFLDFANQVANSFIVRDAWGDEVDIRDVELILTVSMVKLWNSYSSCADYLSKSERNGYTFGVTKTSPKRLEDERNLNYQFIQSYDLSDDDIMELISPTISEIESVLSGDWRKAVLFLKGSGLTETNIHKAENDYVKALMIDQSLHNDPFVRSCIYRQIKNRINEAKVGVIKVHANYSIISGDPYLLCESVFGLKPVGLLKSGEIYNKYWSDCNASKLACFRAPMTCHNNIRLVKPVTSEAIAHWYKYLDTVTIFNAWDTTTAALNGCDFDGDIVMLTDNKVLVDRLVELPTLLCEQRNAVKIVPTEEDFIQSNIGSFGNDIGQTTNWITSMFEVRSKFPKGSDEYNILSYRIRCGQLYQQNAIDKAKGIVCKPMPRLWYDRHATNAIEDQAQGDLYRRIVAGKKPYFMRYIYPPLSKQYNTYIKNTERNSLREFGVSVANLQSMEKGELTERQKEFLKYYDICMPVGISDCVMNKICRIFESKFDGYLSKGGSEKEFDYRILKSGVQYTTRQYSAIKSIYDEYNSRLVSYSVFMRNEKVDELDSFVILQTLNDDFRRECDKACSDKYALCDILVDLCYSRSATKRFVWAMCGDVIIENLLKRSGGIISVPVLDESGDIEFSGKRFSVIETNMEVE